MTMLIYIVVLSYYSSKNWLKILAYETCSRLFNMCSMWLLMSALLCGMIFNYVKQKVCVMEVTQGDV